MEEQTQAKEKQRPGDGLRLPSCLPRCSRRSATLLAAAEGIADNEIMWMVKPAKNWETRVKTA
jgi:hypothetical protein